MRLNSIQHHRELLDRFILLSILHVLIRTEPPPALLHSSRNAKSSPKTDYTRAVFRHAFFRVCLRWKIERAKNLCNNIYLKKNTKKKLTHTHIRCWSTPRKIKYFRITRLVVFALAAVASHQGDGEPKTICVWCAYVCKSLNLIFLTRCDKQKSIQTILQAAKRGVRVLWMAEGRAMLDFGVSLASHQSRTSQVREVKAWAISAASIPEPYSHERNMRTARVVLLMLFTSSAKVCWKWFTFLYFRMTI